jgi:hypothetical protein
MRRSVRSELTLRLIILRLRRLISATNLRLRFTLLIGMAGVGFTVVRKRLVSASGVD